MSETDGNEDNSVGEEADLAAEDVEKEDLKEITERLESQDFKQVVDSEEAIGKYEIIEKNNLEIEDELKKINSDEDERVDSDEEDTEMALDVGSNNSSMENQQKKEIQDKFFAEYAIRDKEEEFEEPDEKEELIEDETFVFDREEYILKYKELNHEKNDLTLRNSILQRKLTEYFKKKKIIQKPNSITELTPEKIQKQYEDLLLAYEKAKIVNLETETLLKQDLEKLKLEHNEKSKKFQEEFSDFVKLEKSIGSSVTYASSGKPINKEFLAKTIARQFSKVDELSAIRYKYIKCRNIVTANEQKLEEVERLEDNLTLKEYEKLTDDNEIFMKKLEDHERDLTKQRNICFQYHEKIAHMKEEINCETEKCDEMEVKLASTDDKCNNARAAFGLRKDKLKNIQAKLETEKKLSGLLALPELHRDFRKTAKVVDELKQQQKEILEDLNSSRKKRESASAPPKVNEQKLRIKPKLHRSANLVKSRCGC